MSEETIVFNYLWNHGHRQSAQDFAKIKAFQYVQEKGQKNEVEKFLKLHPELASISDEETYNFDNLHIAFDYLVKHDYLKTAKRLVKKYIENCSSLSMSERLKNVEKMSKPCKKRNLSTIWAQFQLKKKRLGELSPLKGLSDSKICNLQLESWTSIREAFSED